MRASRSCRGRRGGLGGLHQPTARPPLPGGLPRTRGVGSRGSLVSVTGAPGASSPPRSGSGPALGWEFGVEGPDVLIGDGQVGGSHARGVLRGEGTQSAWPEPPPETPNRIPPGPAALEREGRFPFVLIPINCINYLLCSWLGGGLASLSPSWNFGKTPKKTPPAPAPGAQ